MASYLSNGMVA